MPVGVFTVIVIPSSVTRLQLLEPTTIGALLVSGHAPPMLRDPTV
jgi:hypothetical protein